MSEEYVTVTEITEQPEALAGILAELDAATDELRELVGPDTTFCVTGCGTSYYLAQSGSSVLNEVATSIAVPGSEAFLSTQQLPDDGVDVIIPVSRSGESTETVLAAEALIERYPDATVLGITCTKGSSLFELSDFPILSPEGAEDSVVMTKSFSSMLIAFEFLASLITGENGGIHLFNTVPAQSKDVLEEAKPIAKSLGDNTDFEKFFFLGTGELYGLAAEGMLKLEEMTLSWTKAYHSLEFRHGPQSIADETTLVTVLLPDREYDYHARLLSDINDLGATTLAVGKPSAIESVEADYTVTVPANDIHALPLYTPVFQLLGFYRALALGLNPDEPQNLTQVVRL